ncbi:helix-turn-helix domain-containing protein [Methylocella sp.]|uniref:methylation-associated defense system helix-turn-helix domain-containing protein MAD1 n=1 Tax=Methylocella sp. TaxID=1978226 RepID=UPI0035B2C588
MPDEILTLPEVAGLLKVAEKTVYTMAQRAEIPAFKVRGQWRFKRVDLDSWIEAQKASLNPATVHNETPPSDSAAEHGGRQDDH